jgi:hypothetical protein
VFWVPAISRGSFELAYKEIGIRLDVLRVTDDHANVTQLVKDALDSDITCEWLMIVDNADNPKVLMSSTNAGVSVARLVDYLPKSDRGKIVFNTRSRKAAGDLIQSSKLELKDMGEAGARQLLSRRVSNQALLVDTKAVVSREEHLCGRHQSPGSRRVSCGEGGKSGERDAIQHGILEEEEEDEEDK